MPDYEILNRDVSFKGRAFEVHQLDVSLPNGLRHRFDLVQHKNSITILPLDEDGSLYFVSQYRVGAAAQLLELPAGVLEEGEDAREGAGREVREETGLAAKELVEIGQAYLAPGYSTELMFFFLARGLYADPLTPDADEFLSLIKIPAQEAYRMARSGQIQDSKTLAALLLAEKHIFKAGE